METNSANEIQAKWLKFKLIIIDLTLLVNWTQNLEPSDRHVKTIHPYLRLAETQLQHLKRLLEDWCLFFDQICVAIFFLDGFHGGQQWVKNLVVLIFESVKALHHGLRTAENLLLRQRRHLADLLNLLSEKNIKNIMVRRATLRRVCL